MSLHGSYTVQTSKLQNCINFKKYLAHSLKYNLPERKLQKIITNLLAKKFRDGESNNFITVWNLIHFVL